MYLSHRRSLQLQAMLVAILLYCVLFLILFFKINPALLGFTVPHIQEKDHQQQPQQKPVPVIYTQTNNQNGTSYMQTGGSQSAQTQQQSQTDTSQQQKQATNTARQQPQQENQAKAATPSQTMQPPGNDTQKMHTTPKQSSQHHTQSRRVNKQKWYKKEVSHNAGQSSKPIGLPLGKQLQQAVQDYAHEVSNSQATASVASSTNGAPGNASNAQRNVQQFSYDTFEKKSDYAITESSRKMQFWVHTTQPLKGSMVAQYTTDRSGNLLGKAILQSSGNRAIDKTIIRIIEHAHLPPLPHDYSEDTYTRTIGVDIRKSPGNHPLILSIIAR